jgi:type VI secretion system protein ImpK
MQHHLVVQECFNAVVRLREAGDNASCADDVHSVLTSALQRLLKQPEALDLGPQDAADTAFAIAALADEIAMRAPLAVAERWQHRKLQISFFNEPLAGEVFYERLQQLRQNPQSASNVILAYYTALALGFEGRLGDDAGREQIQSLLASLRQILEGPQSSLKAPLSPYPLAQRSALAPRPKRPRGSTYALLMVLLVVGVAVMGMQVVLRVRVAQVEELATLRATQLMDVQPMGTPEDKQ